MYDPMISVAATASAEAEVLISLCQVPFGA